MEPKDRTKEVAFDDAAHADIASGVEIMRKSVGSTYGPGGRNVLIQKKYVHPVLTRDGVTVARDIAGYGNKLPNKRAGEAAKLIYQASEKTNKTAGDGTTATVVLLAELYKAGYKQITAGEDAMVVKRKLDKDRDAVLKYVESKSVECSKTKLDQVAYIACGDQALADMISDLVYDVGADGAITISYQNAPNVQVEKVTGYLFGQGFRHLQSELEFDSPIVFVTQKRMASKTDIIPVLELIATNQKQAIIIGDVSGAAMETLVWAIQNQKADAIVIPPPAFGADGHEYFEDIATYTGANLWLESDSFKDVALEDFGAIKGARVGQDKCILFGDDDRVVNGEAVNESQQALNATKMELDTVKAEAGVPMPKPITLEEKTTYEQTRRELHTRLADAEQALKLAEKNVVKPVTIGEEIAKRIKLIRDQIDSGEMTPSMMENLEQRFAKLAGKVSIIKVGAATEVEREELFFRVEDAVEACKSALSSGVVAGGATTLLFASQYKGTGKIMNDQVFKSEPILEPFVTAALQQPFRLLMTNAAYDAGDYLQQVLRSKYGKGFNLHEMTDKPIDLIEAGIVDATKVVLQTVKNAFSVAGALLTTGTVITEVDDEPTATSKG
jgi:chaperonin GroEL